MNRQRKVVITITYNEMGIIIDTKAEELALSAQPDQRSFSCGQENDMISRQDAIEAILAVTGNSSVRELYEHVQEHGLSDMWSGGVNAAIDIIIAVPSAQPEIVRCKDCRWHKTDINQCGRQICAVMYDDDYCSYAEQKDGDTDE